MGSWLVPDLRAVPKAQRTATKLQVEHHANTDTDTICPSQLRPHLHAHAHMVLPQPHTHPVSGDVFIYMLSSCPQPAVHAHRVPVSHTESRVYRARGTMSALPSRASSIVPTERPSKLRTSRKLRTCKYASGHACLLLMQVVCLSLVGPGDKAPTTKRGSTPTAFFSWPQEPSRLYYQRCSCTQSTSQPTFLNDNLKWIGLRWLYTTYSQAVAGVTVQRGVWPPILASAQWCPQWCNSLAPTPTGSNNMHDVDHLWLANC